mgnify:FL=1
MNPISPLFEKIDASIGKKVDLIESSYARYALRSIMACAFLTLGTGVAYGIAIKGEHIVPGLGKMLYAFMFSWSLVMILYMNAELGTSNMLYMTVGYYRRRLNFLKAAKILWTCILFNLIGGIIFAYLLSLTGPFQYLPHNSYLFESAVTKLSKSTLQIFIEGIFANIVVNVAVLVSMRMKDDAGKILAIIFIIFIFAYLGFEHVIANFPFFTLAYFASNGTIAGMDFGSVMHNLTFALLGNYVGGGLIIGLGYAWLNNSKSTYVD